ncbi:MAG: alanine racemase [Gemmatimonadota bacterium]|jgi:alanine racemase
MLIDRRDFVGSLVTSALYRGVRGLARAGRQETAPVRGDRFDPWVEVDPAALAHNVGVVSRLTSGRPIMAVLKNNAYGLGLAEASRLLAAHAEVMGFAVVKPEDALALRAAGIGKPVLLMGMAPDSLVADLVAGNVHLSLYLEDDAERLPGLASGSGPIPAHIYVDTGMSRMGVPYHRALPVLRSIAERRAFRIDGTFMAFTEEPDFDPEQLRRFLELAASARGLGISPGRLHAASSNGVFHLPDAHLDLVRPGMALFGGYPSRPDEERAKAALVPAARLRCRVVRVARLRPGDTVSYGRDYVAERPTWIATLPAGHVDGYPRGAVGGARILIGGRTYPVIGAVSASHIIVEVGDEHTVSVGDVATLVGPDHPAIHPNEVARVSGGSVYDVFMHLNPQLPRFVL